MDGLGSTSNLIRGESHYRVAIRRLCGPTGMPRKPGVLVPGVFQNPSRQRIFHQPWQHRWQVGRHLSRDRVPLPP